MTIWMQANEAVSKISGCVVARNSILECLRAGTGFTDILCPSVVARLDSTLPVARIAPNTRHVGTTTATSKSELAVS